MLALCVSWITSDQLYYFVCLDFWGLFGSLVPTMCNRTSCAHGHELAQGPGGDNWKGTLFWWFHIVGLCCFCEISAFCFSWVTYDQVYHYCCLACCVLFGYRCDKQSETVRLAPKCRSQKKKTVITRRAYTSREKWEIKITSLFIIAWTQSSCYSY